MISDTHNTAGFTLLELLIALVLTGLIAVVVSGALQLGSSASVRINNQSEIIATNFVTQRFLRKVLSSTQTGHIEDPGHPDSFVPILGEENQILFLSEIQRYPQQKEPVWMVLWTDQQPDTAGLYLAIHPYNDEEQQDLQQLITEAYQIQGSWEQIISNNQIDGINISYLEIDDFGSANQINEWRYEQALPAAISISFSNQSEPVRGWPELIIPLQEDAYVIRQPE